MARNRWLVRVLTVCAVWLCAGVARGDIGTPTWNWSNGNTWGYGYMASFGQTFVGNGEACTGFRFRSYSESGYYNYPYQAMVYRWSAASQRAIGAPLAIANSTFAQGNCCWFDRELQFPTRVELQQGVDYVLILTVTPWWGNYCCAYAHPAIHYSNEYSQGNLYYLSNGADANAWTGQQWNDSGYDLNFTIRTTADCDSNGIIDAEEITSGAAPDCNANGFLDACEQLAPGTETLIGNEQGPIGSTAAATYTFNAVLPAQGDVQLRVDAMGDLSSTHEFLLVAVGSGPAHAVFTGAESDCAWLTETITIPREEFNAAIVKNSVFVTVSASPTVDGAACDGLSLVKVQLDYTESYPDCNGNLIGDFEDFCSGFSVDCNGNRNPDECDLASGASLDIDGDSVPDECQPDCNGDHRPDAFQIFVGEEPDCNANGLPDECDLYAAGASDDCNSNGVPDECDIAGGVAPDCDGDGKIDSCALAQALVPDCNGNGVPDSCDIASGLSQDCDGDAYPDSCNIAGLWRTSPTQAPFQSGSPLSWTMTGAPMAEMDPVVEVSYYGYAIPCYSGSYYYRLYVDGNEIAAFYDQCYGGCIGNTRQFSVPMSLWNAVAADGVVSVLVTHPNYTSCSSSFCNVRVRTVAPALDCNSNSIPDSCDIASGFDHDCNNNGQLDGCDIAQGAEDDNLNGYPDPCELDRGDLNLDGNVDGPDLAIMLAYWGGVNYPIGDCSHDGVIDGADLAILLSNWDEPL